MSSKKRKLQSNNTTGYTGVYKNGNGKRFQAQIYFDGKSKSLGMYATSKEAALAYDHAVIQHNLPSSKLNYPDGLPIDDKDYDALMNPKRTRRKLSSANTTGYTGVAKIKPTRFSAEIYVDCQKKSLGRYGTAKEAALAYDRAVIQHKLSSSKLNFPNDYTTSSEDDESSEEESANGGKSNTCHNKDDDDDKNEDDDAHVPFPSPQARPSSFQKESMLDQLVAAAEEHQNKKQDEQ